MATETETFALELEDGISDPSRDALRALEQLKAKIEQDTRSLRAMNQAMARLRAGGLAGSAQFRELRDRVAAQRAAIAQAQARYISLGGSLDGLAANAGNAGGGLAKLLEAAQATPGPLGAVTGRLGALRGLLAGGPLVAGGLALAAAMMAIVAASAALVAAVGTATAALLRYGIAQAGARRAELLRLEGLVRIRSMYRLTAGSATELQGAIDRVSDSSALGRGQVAGYAEQLYRMGLRGRALEDALDGMAIAGSAGGEQLARRFAGLAVGAARMGRSVRAVTDDFRARFGGIAAAQALDFDRQIERVRENIARIFDGLKIEPFLRALRQVTSLFSQSTASGRALRHLVELIFQPLLDQAGRGGIVVRRFFQGMILGAQRLTILFLRARNALLRTFGGTDVLGAIDGQRIALTLGAVAVGGFVAAVIAAGSVLALLVAPFVASYLAVTALRKAFDDLRGAFSGMLEAGDRLATALVQGLVKGIESGRALVLTRVRDLASSATGTLREALQIRSPSRVFAQLGVQIPRGLAAGVEAGSPAAEGAVAGMVGPSDVGRGIAGAGSRVSVSIGDVVVHVGESAQPREIGRAIRDEIVAALEGVGIELGMEPAT